MKYSVFLYFVSVLLASCDLHEDAGDKTFNQNLQSFNADLGRADSSTLLLDQMQQRLDKVRSDRESGYLSEDDANQAISRIQRTYSRRISGGQDISSYKRLPAWAVKLGLTLPENMIVDPDFSLITNEGDTQDSFNSLVLVYRGDYQRAMQQAGNIARYAQIPMSRDFSEAQELASEYGIESLKGVAYMNFELSDTELPPYAVSITVDESGTLTISATSTEHLRLLETK